MELSSTVTPLQLTLICILSSLLLVWMGTTLWLALRPSIEQVQHEDMQLPLSPSRILPAQQVMVQAQLRIADVGREMALEGS